MCKTTHKTALPCKHAWAEISAPCAPGKGFDTCPVFFEEFNQGLVIKETKGYNPRKVSFVDSRDSCPFCLVYSSSRDCYSSSSASSCCFSGALVHPPPGGIGIGNGVGHGHGHGHGHEHGIGNGFINSIINGTANLAYAQNGNGITPNGGIAVYAGNGTFLHGENGVVNLLYNHNHPGNTTTNSTTNPNTIGINNGNGNACVLYVPGTAAGAEGCCCSPVIELGIDSNRIRLIKEIRRGIKIGGGARKKDFGVEIGGGSGFSCGCVVM